MGPSAQNSDFRKSKMADGRHFGFRFWPIISASINIFEPNLVQRWKIGSPTGPVLGNQVFENSRWRSIFGHNFGVDQHFCAKFGTVIENRVSFSSGPDQHDLLDSDDHPVRTSELLLLSYSETNQTLVTLSSQFNQTICQHLAFVFSNGVHAY